MAALLATPAYDPPVVLARLEDRAIDESSGIVASRRNPGLFWTHNDHHPDLFAVDLHGKSHGTWRLPVNPYDWEDISAGPGPARGSPYLYAGDIGDNLRRRSEVVVYRFEEPAINAKARLGDVRPTGPVEAFRFRYPDGPHDAEALLVHPQSGDLYIVTKARGEDTETGVYKASPPLSKGAANALAKIASLHFPEESVFTLLIGRVTGGDISPDGRRIALCDYFKGYEAALPEREKNFDAIWKQPFTAFDLGPRRQGESICYRLDGNAFLATSEGVPCPLIEVRRR